MSGDILRFEGADESVIFLPHLHDL